MSRDIKFRGKLHDEDRWVYGYYAKTVVNDGIPFCLEDCRIHNIIIENGIMWFVVPETVGQFTGLRDSKGVEVYEDDFITALKHNEFPHTHAISWRVGMFWFGNWNWYEFLNIFRSIEIVGNSYENPEIPSGGIPNE